MSLITAEMTDAIGTVLNRRVSFPVEESDLRRWAVAVYWPEPPPRCLWDRAYAEQTQPEGFVAPAEFNPFCWMVASEEGHAEMPVPPWKVRVNGGVSMEYGEPIRPGDVITGVRTVADYAERTGRNGKMLLATSADHWTNQHGQTVKDHRFTVIYFGFDDA